jgi:hypothetical protein
VRERGFKATALMLSLKADGKRYRKAQMLAPEK